MIHAKLIIVTKDTTTNIRVETLKKIRETLKEDGVLIDIQVTDFKQTLTDGLKEILDSLGVGESVTRENICNTLWGRYDYSTSRSFDVYYSKYKKGSTKKFRMKVGVITRIA